MSFTVVNVRAVPAADFASGKAVYLGRPMPNVPGTGRFGNPHKVGWCPQCRVTHTREEAIARFREEFHRRIATDPAYREEVNALRRHEHFACWCAPLACHVDVIVSYLLES